MSMSVQQRIRSKLTEALAPTRLEIVDESHRHVGHAGHRPEGETHFRIHIVSAAFEGKGRLERHRLVHAALADELAERVHALAVEARAPDETPPS